jgi:hypothetical protein
MRRRPRRGPDSRRDPSRSRATPMSLAGYIATATGVLDDEAMPSPS